jgi:hypothetical protein
VGSFVFELDRWEEKKEKPCVVNVQKNKIQKSGRDHIIQGKMIFVAVKPKYFVVM